MMLQRVKRSLRITSPAFDTEIQDLINAALADLGISGVDNSDEMDPLIIQAVITYCKANFGLENADSEKYAESYKSQKITLALSGVYNGVL